MARRIAWSLIVVRVSPTRAKVSDFRFLWSTSTDRYASVVEDLLQLGEEGGVEGVELRDHLLQLLAGDGLDGQAGLLRLGQEVLVLQGGLQRGAEKLDAVLRGAGRCREGAAVGGGVVGAHLDQAARLVGLGERDGLR